MEKLHQDVDRMVALRNESIQREKELKQQTSEV
jgi:hypothetical protein